ncbi:MAG: hypothetical protein IEMM0006_1838 [bacterium]|nr:MAG: hypothetical protein IEMM0006_1838 [bacterium]
MARTFTKENIYKTMGQLIISLNNLFMNNHFPIIKDYRFTTVLSQKWENRWVLILFLLFLLLGSGMWTTAVSQTNNRTHFLTLKKVLELALQNSPDLSSNKQMAEAEHQNLKAAENQRIPTIGLSASGQYRTLQERRLIPGGARLGFQQPDGLQLNEIFNRGIIAVEPTLSLPLYTGGQINAGIAAAGALFKASKQQVTMTSDQLLFNVTLQYLHLLQTKEAIMSRQASVRALKKTSYFIQKKLSAGKALYVDLLRVQTRLSDLHVDLLQAENEYDATLNELSRLVGTALDSSGTVLLDTLTYHPVLIPLFRLSNIEHTNPLIQFNRLRLSYTRQQRRLMQAQLLPHVNLMLKYGWYWGENAKDSPYYAKNNQVLYPLLSVRVPILNFSSYRHIDASAHLVRAQSKRLEQIQLDVGNAMKNAQLQLQVAKASIRAANKAVQTAEEAFRIRQHGFQAGKATIDDLLYAEAALLNAQLKQQHTLVQYYTAVASILRLRGRLRITDISFFTTSN